MIAVIGGGLIGACVASELLAAGADVLVFDAGKPGAAWRASAGLLTPSGEALTGRLRREAEVSLRLWPQFARRLEAASGIEVDLCHGLARIAHSEPEAQLLRREPDGVWAAPDEQWPFGHRWSAGEGSVHPLRVREAALHGVNVVRSEVHSLHSDKRGVVIHCRGAQYHAGAAVVAAGAWSGRFGVPVAPVQGQAWLQGGELPYPTYTSRGYALPRRDGVYLGATERRTWDTAPDEAGRAWLQKTRREVFPALDGLDVRAHLVGLRPYRAGGVPFVGLHPRLPRVVVATGHYRHGVLLAPATARRVVRLCRPWFTR